jgi:hypothetical protein
MHSTPQPPNAAATEHLVTAERLLAEPLVKRGERDRHVRVALVHATLAVAAGVLGEWPATTGREDAGPDRGI